MISLNELGDNITNELKNGSRMIDLCNVLESYNSDDWCDYVQFDNTKYLKHLVYSNDYIDIFIICWNTNQKSGVHDHPENGCLMRILEGKLQEDIYIKDDGQYKFYFSSRILEGGATYKEKNLCVHDIINIANKTVSLHIYSPPNYKPNYY